ncbi:MAG TPA: ATP synthase F0 subunit B [Firmicutes bacterium]|nr:ATP synthase F0 subunit B [Bacillota bacterium]
MQEALFSTQAASAGRVFALDSQTLIGIAIQLVNAAILAVGLGYMLYNPVKDFMRKRTERIQAQMDEADAALAKANSLIAEYDAKLKSIGDERVKVLEAARLEAAEESKEIIAEAKKEAERIRERSLEAVAAYRRRLEEETRLYIIEAASLMAQQIVAQTIDDEAQTKLIEQALADLEDAQWH